MNADAYDSDELLTARNKFVALNLSAAGLAETTPSARTKSSLSSAFFDEALRDLDRGLMLTPQA